MFNLIELLNNSEAGNEISSEVINSTRYTPKCLIDNNLQRNFEGVILTVGNNLEYIPSVLIEMHKKYSEGYFNISNSNIESIFSTLARSSSTPFILNEVRKSFKQFILQNIETYNKYLINSNYYDKLLLKDDFLPAVNNSVDVFLGRKQRYLSESDLEHDLVSTFYYCKNQKLIISLMIKKDNIEIYKTNLNNNVINSETVEFWVDKSFFHGNSKKKFDLYLKNFLFSMTLRGVKIVEKEDILFELCNVPINVNSYEELEILKVNINKVLKNEL